MADGELPDYVLTNRAHWDRTAEEWVAAGERAWAASEPYWGRWGLPESELGLLRGGSGSAELRPGCVAAHLTARRRGSSIQVWLGTAASSGGGSASDTGGPEGRSLT